MATWEALAQQAQQALQAQRLCGRMGKQATTTLRSW
jgi:hypothetical protein